MEHQCVTRKRTAIEFSATGIPWRHRGLLACHLCACVAVAYGSQAAFSLGDDADGRLFRCHELDFFNSVNGWATHKRNLASEPGSRMGHAGRGTVAWRKATSQRLDLAWLLLRRRWLDLGNAVDTAIDWWTIVGGGFILLGLLYRFIDLRARDGASA